MGGCVMLGRGEGHGEWQGEWHGEEAGLEEREEADLRQRGLHHSFWDTRWTSCLAFCRRRAATHRNYTFIKLHLLTFGAGLQRPYFALWFVPFHLYNYTSSAHMSLMLHTWIQWQPLKGLYSFILRNLWNEHLALFLKYTRKCLNVCVKITNPVGVWENGAVWMIVCVCVFR